ncbi:thioredoxin domain-containing protein [Rhodoferax sp.]|uniref:thioredoxin family protein n=1 Tax=Rhodoferax sp. TaxID=50421 RepID=UPI00262E2394|nr:thioredoxin domain-containing protein [Rhodoferax sp.]MDD2809624.1 thioredoxin domain-containing protein [Rhodoferax sp.]
MTHVIDVEEADFEARVVLASHQVPVVLDIGAKWCSPCRVLTPLLERLAVQYSGQFILAKVDADENMRIAGRHQAKGFPTVVAYSHGLVTDRFHSMQTEGFLRSFLDRLIAHHASGTAAAVEANPPTADTSTQKVP